MSRVGERPSDWGTSMAPAPFGAYPAGDDNTSLVRDPVDHIGRYLAADDLAENGIAHEICSFL